MMKRNKTQEIADVCPFMKLFGQIAVVCPFMSTLDKSQTSACCSPDSLFVIGGDVYRCSVGGHRKGRSTLCGGIKISNQETMCLPSITKAAQVKPFKCLSTCVVRLFPHRKERAAAQARWERGSCFSAGW